MRRYIFFASVLIRLIKNNFCIQDPQGFRGLREAWKRKGKRKEEKGLNRGKGEDEYMTVWIIFSFFGNTATAGTQEIEHKAPQPGLVCSSRRPVQGLSLSTSQSSYARQLLLHTPHTSYLSFSLCRGWFPSRIRLSLLLHEHVKVEKYSFSCKPAYVMEHILC